MNKALRCSKREGTTWRITSHLVLAFTFFHSNLSDFELRLTSNATDTANTHIPH